jgi:hypothetical protein
MTFRLLSHASFLQELASSQESDKTRTICEGMETFLVRRIFCINLRFVDRKLRCLARETPVQPSTW